MAVYRPQYKDKKTGEMKHTKIWYYEFIFAGRLVKESAKTQSKTVAKLAEQARRRELEKGFNGVSDERPERIRGIEALSGSSSRTTGCVNPNRQASQNTLSATLFAFSVTGWLSI